MFGNGESEHLLRKTDCLPGLIRAAHVILCKLLWIDARWHATQIYNGTSSMVSCVLALDRVNVVAVTTILVLHVGVVGHHVPCHYDFMFPRRSYHARLRARAVWEALPPGGRPGGFGGGTPPNSGGEKKFIDPSPPMNCFCSFMA